MGLVAAVLLSLGVGLVVAQNEAYEGESFCRLAPAWPGGSYLGQMHPYHVDFYTDYAAKRNWDPCQTWAAEQRDSAIRGLRELGYAVYIPTPEPTPAPPTPPAVPSVLFASDLEECTGSGADNFIAAAAGRGELTVTATVDLGIGDEGFGTVAEVVLTGAHGRDLSDFDGLVIGAHAVVDNPDVYLSLSWLRGVDGDDSVVATWAWEDIFAINYDDPFDIRFTYNNGWVGFSINGATMLVEEGLPYGAEAWVALACNDYGDGGTVTYTNIRIEGHPL